MRLTPPTATLLLSLALPGCAAITALGEASRPLEIYELRATSVGAASTARRALELVVEEPQAGGALATERIMIRPGPLRAQYLPGVRWADPAPAMLQTLMVRSLIETGALGSVGRRPVGTSADFAVLGELTDFQAEVTGAGTTIRIRLILRIADERAARIAATRTFAVTEGAGSAETDDVVAAFDRAAGRLLADVVPWLLSNLNPA